MSEYTLTELQYSNDRIGPFRLYIYNRHGYHSGGQWFRRLPLKYPDEEISCREAMVLALEAAADGLEVRITDSGDMLIYHCKGANVLYPKPVGNFWKDIGA